MALSSEGVSDTKAYIAAFSIDDHAYVAEIEGKVVGIAILEEYINRHS
ncbi:hypothetical protein AB1L05_22400 [Cytobacillus horneckiae]